MGQSAVKNPRKIFSQTGADPALNTRVTTLENNEYKITYYEIVSGTSGSLTTPTNSTINSGEFGVSGNAILSKIDSSNKPTYESPKTIDGTVVTASLNTTTKAWVASGIYTDTSVALIYSIKIKAIYYSNLNYDRIIETVDLSVTKTSDLINDGDDGVSPFITLNDLPSNIILYPTTAASDVVGYFKLVNSINDPSYNTLPVDVSTGIITTTNQLISSLVTEPNIIVGNPGVFNITTIGNISKTSGTGNAEFYFEVYKRDSLGIETLITTSDNTVPVVNTGYSEFSATALWNNGIFINTDRIVLKFYASRIVTGSDPTYNFQFGGITPVRTLVPIPLTVIPSNVIVDNSTIIGNGTSLSPFEVGSLSDIANNKFLLFGSSQWTTTAPSTILPSGATANGFNFFTDLGSKSLSGTTSYDEYFISAGRTLTLTGTSGTANINILGVNYLTTFTTNLTTTANNFVTAHQSTLLALGVQVFANLGVLKFGKTSDPAGGSVDLAAITITTLTGNLSGTFSVTSNDHLVIPYSGRPYFGERLNHFIRINFNIDSGSNNEYSLTLRRWQNDTQIGSEIIITRSTTLTGQQEVFVSFTGGATDPFVTGGFYFALRNPSANNVTISGAAGILIETFYQKPTNF